MKTISPPSPLCQAEYQANYKRERAASNRQWRLDRAARSEAEAHDRLRRQVWHDLCSRMRTALREQGAKRVGDYAAMVGCDIDTLLGRLDLMFKAGMTWENYGRRWVIDHIKECCLFDLRDAAEQRVCFHYTNLQPLSQARNVRKGLAARKSLRLYKTF